MDYEGLNFSRSLWMCNAMPSVYFSSTCSPPKVYAVLLMFVINMYIQHLYTLFLLIFVNIHLVLLPFLSGLHVSIWDHFPPDWKLPALRPSMKMCSWQVILIFASLKMFLSHLHLKNIAKNKRTLGFFHCFEEIIQSHWDSHDFPSEVRCWSCCFKELSFQHLWLFLRFPFIFGLQKLQWRVQSTVFFVFILWGLTGLILRRDVFQHFLEVLWDAWPLFLQILLLSIAFFSSLFGTTITPFHYVPCVSYFLFFPPNHLSFCASVWIYFTDLLLAHECCLEYLDIILCLLIEIWISFIFIFPL